jgi:hypothetical protein
LHSVTGAVYCCFNTINGEWEGYPYRERKKRKKKKPAIQTYGTGFLINPYENQLLLLVIVVN